MRIDYQSISNALNYGIIPSTRILIRIADFFLVSFDYLLGKTEDDYFARAENPTTFKERFMDLCREKGVTYYRVSKSCHFDPSYISRWIHKNYLPSLEILDVVCDYFKVSNDYLLGRTDDRN